MPERPPRGGSHGHAAVLCLATWVGVGLLVASDERLMSGIFGVVISLYAIVGLMRPVPRPVRRAERWMSPLIGIANGLLNGLTGSYVFPGVLFRRCVSAVRA